LHEDSESPDKLAVIFPVCIGENFEKQTWSKAIKIEKEFPSFIPT